MTVNGKSAPQARLDRDYGMVFQAPILFDWRTVQANVELPLEINGTPKAERARRAEDNLRLVELTDFAGHYPWQLSGGMQQRVAIARALAVDPAILLMDEPFGALDEMTRERMNLELLKIWERTSTTVMFVTHSIAEAVFLSTRVVVMSPRPGRISAVIDIDLPRERTVDTREMDAYFRLVTEVREALRGDERRAGAAERTATTGCGGPTGRGRGAVRVSGATAPAAADARPRASASATGLATGRRRSCCSSACLVAWEVLVRALGIKQFILPSPIAIAVAWQTYLPELLAAAALHVRRDHRAGWSSAPATGILVGAITARYRSMQDSLMPFAVAASSVPILAFAPLFNNWFGLDQQLSKAMVAAALCFFPVMINTVRGLTTVDPAVARAAALVRRARGRRCSGSCASPTRCRTSSRRCAWPSTLATIGAVVGEYFAAPRASLGQYIATYSAFLNFERSWAAIVFACAIGIGLYLVVVVAERIVMPWHDRRAALELTTAR